MSRKPRVKKPFPYYGGKHYMVKKMLELIPEHITYVEVFGGSAALLFAKEPSKVEVYNDVDGDLVNFFRVLRDPRKYKRLIRMARLTPYSREEFFKCYDRLDEGIECEVERAFRYWFISKLAFSGGGQAGRRSVRTAVVTSSGGMAGVVYNYLVSVHKRYNYENSQMHKAFFYSIMDFSLSQNFSTTILAGFTRF